MPPKLLTPSLKLPVGTPTLIEPVATLIPFTETKAKLLSVLSFAPHLGGCRVGGRAGGAGG